MLTGRLSAAARLKCTVASRDLVFFWEESLSISNLNAAPGGCLAGLTRSPSKGGLDHCSTEGRGAVPFTHNALASTMQTAAETRIRPNHGVHVMWK